jgi:hypothetical protein
MALNRLSFVLPVVHEEALAGADLAKQAVEGTY